MEKENIEKKEKQEKKILKIKEKKEKKNKQSKKEKKKIDKFTIFGKILAACLVAFMLLGTCYTFIYLVVNS